MINNRFSQLPEGGVAVGNLILRTPKVASHSDTAAMLSLVSRLVASGIAESKAELTSVTGLSRSTVSAYVDRLLRRNVLRIAGYKTPEGRGRPADRLVLATEAGIIAVADVGARRTHLAIVNLAQEILAYDTFLLDVSKGPQVVLTHIHERLLEMTNACGVDAEQVRCAVLGIPARVDRAAGTPVRPIIMPGWDGFPAATYLGQLFDRPVILENDVNLRAVGEAAALPLDQRPILAIKVGTGVGAGLVDVNGEIYHGYDGAAGEIAHISVRGAPDVECGCGAIGCVEAVSSVPSIVQSLKNARPDLLDDNDDHVEQVIALLQQAEPTIRTIVRRAAEQLGAGLAAMCDVLNPRRVVISGTFTGVTDEFLAGVRAVVYQRARPVATRNLIIGHSVLGDLAGIRGATVLGIEEVLSPATFSKM